MTEHHDKPDTIAVTAGRAANGRSLATPMWASSTFETDDVAASLKAATSPKAREFYGRYGNPTVNAFEDAVAALEGAEAAQAFASGMGAITTLVPTWLICDCTASKSANTLRSNWRTSSVPPPS